MVAVLAGQFGLDRIDPRFESLGLFGQARFWMFFPAALAVLRMNAPIGSRSALSSGNKRYVAMVILLHLYLAISALWTPRLLEGSQFVSNSNEVYGVLLLAGMAALVPRLFREATDEKIGFLFRFLLITGIVYAVGGLSGAWHDADNDRMAAFGGGANVFARILGMGTLSSIYFWLRSKRIIWLTPLPLFGAGIVLSGSRGSMLAFGLSLTFFVLIGFREITARWRGGVIAICGLMAILSMSSLSSRVFPYWQERFIEQSLEDRYDSDRLVLFSQAVETFSDHPTFGVGLDGFRRLSDFGEYTHNLFLQFAAEGGIIGLTLLILALIGGVRAWVRSPTLEQRLLFVLAIFVLTAQMFSGSYYDARYMWLFFGVLWVAKDKENGRYGQLSSATPVFRHPSLSCQS
jgi:O-antigen ligase